MSQAQDFLESLLCPRRLVSQMKSLWSVENAHKVLASGKDLQTVETDLDIAQVRAVWKERSLPLGSR